MISFESMKESIYNVVAGEPDVLALLESNRPFDDERGPISKQNSIVPMSEIEKVTPLFIGIQSGETSRTGLYLHDAFFYIRCYNTIDKTYVDIDKILSLLVRRLHNKRLIVPNGVNVKVYHETTGIESIDEALNLRYRESAYRLEVL